MNDKAVVDKIKEIVARVEAIHISLINDVDIFCPACNRCGLVLAYYIHIILLNNIYDMEFVCRECGAKFIGERIGNHMLLKLKGGEKVLEDIIFYDDTMTDEIAKELEMAK